MYMSSNLFESHPEQIKKRSSLGYRARKNYQIIVRCEHITVSLHTVYKLPFSAVSNKNTYRIMFSVVLKVSSVFRNFLDTIAS